MRIGVGARRLGRKEIQRIAAVLFKKVGKAVIVGYVELIPVVKSRAPQLAVVYLKAERAMLPVFCGISGSTRTILMSAKVTPQKRYFRHDLIP